MPGSKIDVGLVVKQRDLADPSLIFCIWHANGLALFLGHPFSYSHIPSNILKKEDLD